MDKNRGFPLGHDKVCSYCHLMHIHSDCGHWGELCDRCEKPDDYNVVDIGRVRADKEKKDRLMKDVCAGCGKVVCRIDGDTCVECERFLCDACGVWREGLMEDERYDKCADCSKFDFGTYTN